MSILPENEVKALADRGILASPFMLSGCNLPVGQNFGPPGKHEENRHGQWPSRSFHLNSIGQGNLHGLGNFPRPGLSTQFGIQYWLIRVHRSHTLRADRLGGDFRRPLPKFAMNNAGPKKGVRRSEDQLNDHLTPPSRVAPQTDHSTSSCLERSCFIGCVAEPSRFWKG